MSNLLKRILSSIILIPSVLWLISQGGLYFDILCGILFGLLIFEWGSLWSQRYIKYTFKTIDIILIILGIAYISLAMYKFWTLKDVQHKQLMTFVIVWSTDMGAYFFGKKFGITPLAPQISPNKTWEGFWGGVLVCIITCSTIMYIQLANLSPYYDISSYFNNFFNNITLFSTLVFSIRFMFYSVAAHIGDLLESLVKRYLGVKDSGRLIPGHGGILDRCDSFLGVCLAYYLKDVLHEYGIFF
jgi:phosphatidate cytidylyltransferase